MPSTASEIWSRLLQRAQLEVSKQVFQTWLEPSEAIEFDGQQLSIATPDQFTADWNTSKYAGLLESMAPIALGRPVSISLERRARPQMDFFIAQDPGKSPPLRRDNGSIVASLNARYTFDTFVVGKANELAAAAANGVAQSPGRVYNPLFIYGATGLGKTHLMQAIAHDILRRQPNIRLICIGAEQFTNEYVHAIQTRSTHPFRQRYREIDLLLVDDIHFLRGKEATQEEFFHTFNALYEAGRQIVMTSDRPPAEIPSIEARLVSRFQWGMVADVDVPDLEHRIAILTEKSRQDHLEETFPSDVIRFIAESVRTNIRELEGSVVKLLALASLKRREISLDLAKEALRDRLPSGLDETPNTPSSLSLSIHSIQQAVATVWNVSVPALISKSRTKQLMIPRQAAMLLGRELLHLQLTDIGLAFGGRDHSTVIHSLNRAQLLLTSNPDFQNKLSTVRALLST
jgi:chromosomal replication initiator protein